MNPTKIEWTGRVSNPFTGCSHAGSPGCDKCYAQAMARRLGWGGLCPPGETREAYKTVIDPETGRWNGRTVFLRDVSEKPLHWKKPQTIFLCSMTDLFQDGIKRNQRLTAMEIVEAADWHTFQILTKRAKNMRDFFLDLYGSGEPDPNLHLGVTICIQAEADENIPFLLQTPAAVRFVSIEPMLGPIDLNFNAAVCNCHRSKTRLRGLTVEGMKHRLDCPECGQERSVVKFDWVILGGETGPGARPMDLDWARSVRDDCIAAGVPLFYKGAGTAGGRKKTDPGYYLLDGQKWKQLPAKKGTGE